MKYQEMIKKISGETFLSQSDVKTVLESLTKNLIEEAKGGSSTKISGLGTFKPVERAARTARNPRTGEPVAVPAKTAFVFKAQDGIMA